MHRHNWSLIDKTVLPPAFTQNGAIKSHSSEDTRLMFDAMRQKVVHVFKCDCGKIKVVKN